VINISEGRAEYIRPIAEAGGGEAVRDVHSDVHHHRSVLTMTGPDDDALFASVQAVATKAVDTLDLRTHRGVHPRLGVVDVVPWVDLNDPWAPWTTRSLAVRDRFKAWAEAELHVPCVIYGPERTLPEIRRTTAPLDTKAGMICVGARGVLVAYNLWLATADVQTAKRIAKDIRQPGLRALGLEVGDQVQVSCNLTDPSRLGPADVYDLVAAQAEIEHAHVARAELVGLIPEALRAAVPESRWDALDLRRTL
jgi:glutamate formiminotransferase